MKVRIQIYEFGYHLRIKENAEVVLARQG